MKVAPARASLLGVALGDSLGLPYEGIPKARGAKLMPFPLRQRLIFGRGALSDDTIQSALVLQALLSYPENPREFQHDFARRLRLWVLSAPPGIGLATLKATLRLNLGAPANRSGVRSAGNGAAMRSAVIGAAFSDEADRRVEFVEAATRVTHTHPLANQGAQIVALAAALAAARREDQFRYLAGELAPDWPWDEGWPDQGPSGYVVHTVNASIDISTRFRNDLSSGIEEAVRFGGDTDTVGAIVGGIIGASGIGTCPENWKRWIGWPTPDEIDHFGSSLKFPYGKLLGQHLVALPAILGFGFRRLLPPY